MNDGMKFWIDNVHVSASTEQVADDDFIAGDDGQVERRVALFIRHVDDGRITFQKHFRTIDRGIFSAVVKCYFTRTVPLPYRRRLSWKKQKKNKKQKKTGNNVYKKSV